MLGSLLSMMTQKKCLPTPQTPVRKTILPAGLANPFKILLFNFIHMTQLETEIQLLKEEVRNMWGLVLSQLQKARTALLEFDKDLAREVILKEKRVNGSELKIDRDCENMFALYSPVAIDLRFLLAILK